MDTSGSTDAYLNPWKTLSDTEIYNTNWIRITRHDVINPHGNPGVYSVVHFKNYAIGIIPIDDEFNTWIVGQYRYPLNQYSWEIIEGGCPRNEIPEIAAKRELREEAGIECNHLIKIQEIHLSNSNTDEFGIIYVAKGLKFFNPEPEDTELLQIRKLPFSDVYQMVLNGEITDGMSVNGILKLKILLEEGKI